MCEEGACVTDALLPGGGPPEPIVKIWHYYALMPFRQLINGVCINGVDYSEENPLNHASGSYPQARSSSDGG